VEVPIPEWREIQELPETGFWAFEM
jgi:hypothetical protein